MAKKPSSDHSLLAINISHEVKREEYLDYMTFQKNERPLFTEIFGPLIGLKEEWEAQGAMASELDLSAYRFRSPARGGIPVNTGGWTGEPAREVLEDNDDYIVYKDHLGRTMKLCKGFATIPLPMDYPVKTMDDWLEIKHHYEFSEERFGGHWQKRAREHLDAGRAVSVGIPGGFDEPRQLMGEEELCVAFYTQPELVKDILETIGDTCCQVLERVTSEIQVDELMVHEDMAGKSGPLAGPSQVAEFIAPYYSKVWDLVRARGARVFGQDSDGNMMGVIKEFVDSGLNFMYPMEPAAGMDIVKIREEYGDKLAFMGGIDKHVLRRGFDAIERELEYKVPPMVATGGCILGLDHRIPNGTPLAAYKFYIEKMWEIMDRETAKL